MILKTDTILRKPSAKIRILVNKIFEEGGLLSETLDNYEHRPQQSAMAGAVLDAIDQKRHLLVEAGTGVGKSFAYLVPIIYHSAYNGKRIVVSTNTISLQEQLIKKDIPFLKNILPLKFNIVLAKGRQNYLCLRRLHQSFAGEGDLFETKKQLSELHRLAHWAEVTSDGSLADLAKQPDPLVWDKICAERGNCMGKKCLYYKKCYFQRARKAMAEAGILIVNHHLFFSDLTLREGGFGLLPNYDCIVFDEAHNIENVATEHMGYTVSNFGVNYILNALYNPSTQKGFLLTIRDFETTPLIETARDKAETFFKEVKDWLAENGAGATKRVRKAGFILNTLDQPLKNIYDSLSNARQAAKNKEQELEIRSHMNKIGETALAVDTFIKHSMDDYVYWVEMTKERRPKISLYASPIEVGPFLRRSIFANIETIIMTSATLAINNSFNYTKERLGIKDALEEILGSPFDYAKQVKLMIPRKMPDPNDGAYKDKVAEKIEYFIGLTHGKAFILFTSYELMDSVYEKVQPYLEGLGIKSFKQGAGLGRHLMLEEFKRDRDSVLFGTDSFWSGVDVQGESLSNVIITRLPFAVPDHPITEARIEHLEQEGRNAFAEYSLPEAVMKLKQGFGRLIRTKKDRGIVAILDSRIIHKSYGRTFLDSLPSCKVELI